MTLDGFDEESATEVFRVNTLSYAKLRTQFIRDAN